MQMKNKIIKNFVFISFFIGLTSLAHAAVELPPIYVSPSGGVVSPEPIQKKKTSIEASKTIPLVESKSMKSEVITAPDKQIILASKGETEVREKVTVDEEEEIKFDVKKLVKPIQYDANIFENKNFSHEFEIGTEIYLYEYEEPSLSVKDKGEFYGVNAAYTLSLPKNYNPLSFVDAIKNSYTPSFFKIEGRFAWGYVDYEGSTTHDNIRDYVLEARGTMGYDIPISENFSVSPYAGIGYRYLNDDFSSVPDQVINGVQFASGYDRESRYAYIPIGLDFNKKIDKKWSVRLNLEYDYLVGGKQKSHFEDSEVNGVNLGYDVHEVDQEEGYGAKASFSIRKKGERVNFFIKPFFNYWDIEDSEFAFRTANGFLIPGDEPGTFLGGIEPANTTKEYGLKIGAEF